MIAVKSGEYGSGSAPANSIVQHVNSLEEALAISGEIEGGDVILVKGSRAEGLEKLSEQIKSSLIERESSAEERQV